MNIKNHMDKSEIASLYYDCIFSFCNQRLPDRQAAEDVTQEVFLALTIENSIKNPDAVLKWLYTVARNKVNDYYRKQYKKPPPVSLDDVGDIPEITFDFTELYSDTELKECENTVLNQLNEQERKRQVQIAIEAQNIRNTGKEGVDWSVRADRTLNYYMIDTDVTKKLNAVIKSSESENWWKRFSKINLVTNIARYVNFAFMVRPGGKYDLKSKTEWQGKEHFIYDGEIIWYDEPGNILYGHLGKVMGFEDIILKSAGGAVQIATRTSSWRYILSYFDDPRDQKAIQKGIDIFKNTHGWIWW